MCMLLLISHAAAAPEQPPPLQIAIWNARRVRPGRGLAADKFDWIVQRMLALGIAVVALLEIGGSYESLRSTRKRLRRKFRLRTDFAPDSRGGNGILIISNPKVAKIKERSLLQLDRFTVRLTTEVPRLGVELPLCVYHGRFDPDDAVAQLAVVSAWARQQMGGLIIADANHVPCRADFRPRADAGVALTRGDMALRRLTGYECSCVHCAEADRSQAALKIAEQITPRGSVVPGGEITRRNSNSEAQLDIAVACGTEGDRWRVVRTIWPERQIGKDLSDHALVVFERASANVAHEQRMHSVGSV